MINYFSPRAKAVFVILLGSYASNSVADEALTYTVKPHDTWGKIARRTLDSPERLAALQALNQQNANTLPQAGSVLRVQPEWRRVLPQQAKVLALTGEPKLVDKRRGMQTLVVGQLLQRGSQIVTDGDASVVLQFADASRLQLYPDSQLTVVKLAKGPRNLPIIKVDLNQGQADNQVVPKSNASRRYEVRTPHAISAVRGTEYRIRADAKSAGAEVLRGKVAVRGRQHNGSVLLPAGFGVSITAGQTARKTALSAAPDIRSIPALLETSPFSVHWQGQSDVASYQVQVAKTADFAIPLLTQTTQKSQLNSKTRLEDGDYFIRIRAADAQGLFGQDAHQAFTLNAFPEAPTVIAPLNGGKVRTPELRLRWNAGLDSSRYRIELAKADDVNFSQPIQQADDLTKTEFAISTLPPGDYRWRVSQRYPEHATDRAYGARSDAMRFSYQPIPDGATASGEYDSQFLTFAWKAGAPDQRYRVQLATNPRFEQPLVDTTVEQATWKTPLPGTGDFYFRVAIVDSDGEQGAFGAVSRVQIPSRWWLLMVPLLPALF